MIFDVKMEDFRRKARLAAGGHRTEAPATITYASVVSRETVHIALLMAALNDLEVKVGDVLNSLAAMDAHERPLFKKLLWGLVSSTIFVRC